MAECNNEIKKIQEVVSLRKQQSDQVKKKDEEKAAAAAAAAVPKYVDCIVPAVEAEPLCQRTLDVASECGAEMQNKKLKTGVSAFLVQYSYRYSRYQC